MRKVIMVISFIMVVFLWNGNADVSECIVFWPFNVNILRTADVLQEILQC